MEPMPDHDWDMPPEQAEALQREHDSLIKPVCEKAVNEEDLVRGGCGTLGEYYFKNNLFTGTMVTFDQSGEKLLYVEEYKDGFPHGLGLSWDDDGLVTAGQNWRNMSHGETITWHANDKRVVWKRYEYDILLESGTCDAAGNAVSRTVALSRAKRRELEHLRETLNFPVLPPLRTVPDEKLSGLMPDYATYFERYRHLRIAPGERARREAREKRREEWLKFAISLFIFLIISAILLYWDYALKTD